MDIKHIVKSLFVFCSSCILLILIGDLSTYAQDRNSSLGPLALNDRIPESVLKTPFAVVNHPDQLDSILLMNYGDQLIVLSFWATWCSSCIENFPNLQQIQLDNQKDIQILLVNSANTRDTPEKAKQFLSKRQKENPLLSVVMDTTLNQLFPHGLIPHYVWIKDGKLLAISTGKDVTQKNIDRVLQGLNISSTYVSEVQYNMRLPLFENGNGGEGANYLYKTFLTRFIPGLRSTMSRNRTEDGLLTKITFTNRTILSLYTYAHPEIQNLSKHQLKIEVNGKETYDGDYSSYDWMEANLYTYELQIPPTSETLVKQIMREDLKRFFGYTIRVENQVLDCWVLNSKVEPLRHSSAQDQSLKSDSKSRDKNSFKELSFIDFLHELENMHTYPIINETGMDSSFLLYVPDELYKTDVLINVLSKQGLLLKKEKRSVPILILSDR